MNDYYISDYTPTKDDMQMPVQSNQSNQVPAPMSEHQNQHMQYPHHHHKHRMHPHHMHPYHMHHDNLTAGELLKRAIKYIIEGVAVAVVAYLILKDRLHLTGKDILILAFTAAITFAILDTFAPTVSAGTKFGAGLGLGAGLVAPTLIPMALI